MALLPGASLGPYQIVALLGVGGMGEVYRARDTKLGRDVALKILPDAFARDPDRLARFQREAHVLASLNHPHIAAIYGLEDAAGVTALVMELVEGDDLSQRIARGPIPLDEALEIARQVAEALEAAHEQGIIHRDLKPANIKVRADGTVKVLDFGLAKALAPASASATADAHAMNSPTLSMHATQAGIILGTASYMSPEQARGTTVDRRADTWAFGVLLFEMLTGRRAFEGETIADVIAAVVTREPDWNALPPAASSSLRRLLARCLKKDPKERLQAIGDARIGINEASAEPPTISSAVVDTRHRTRWTIVVASILSATVAIVAVAAIVFVLRVRSPQPASPGRSVMRFELNLPAGVELFAVSPQSVAPSPDGTRVALVGMLGGVRQIYLRRLDQFEATPLLRGTETATGCFFSPDGRSLGFLSSGSAALKKVSLADGLVVPLAVDVDFSAGGAWGPNDRITFVRAGALWQVPAAGGPATQVTRLDTGKGELSHGWPTAIADGKVVLFTVVTGSGRGAAHIEALTLATGQRQVLVDPGTFPLYAPSGHLVFFRNDVLLAAAFDVNRLLSPPRLLFDQRYAFGGSVTVANYDVSPDGHRFVMVKDESVSGRLNVVLNWFDELKRLVPTK